MTEEETQQPPTASEIKKLLEEEGNLRLSKEKLPYHNWKEHVITVYEDVRLLAEKMDKSDHEIELLQIAALFHDISLGEGDEVVKNGHELRSADYAANNLKSMVFSEVDIERVRKIILGTELIFDEETEKWIYPESNDDLVNIMRDADLAAMGKDGFVEGAGESLRNEFGIEDPVKWAKFEEKFIKEHPYITSAAIDLWDEGRNKNLNIYSELAKS